MMLVYGYMPTAGHSQNFLSRKSHYRPNKVAMRNRLASPNPLTCIYPEVRKIILSSPFSTEAKFVVASLLFTSASDKLVICNFLTFDPCVRQDSVPGKALLIGEGGQPEPIRGCKTKEAHLMIRIHSTVMRRVASQKHLLAMKATELAARKRQERRKASVEEIIAAARGGGAQQAMPSPVACGRSVRPQLACAGSDKPGKSRGLASVSVRITRQDRYGRLSKISSCVVI